MSAVLLKLAKLIPMLGAANPHERLAALSSIERILANEKLTFTDAGQQLATFVRDVMAVEDEPELPPPTEAPIKPTWSNGATPAQTAQQAKRAQHAHNWGVGTPPPPRGNYPPPPPPPTPKWFDVPRSPSELAQRATDLIAKHHYRNLKEREFLESIYFLSSNTQVLTGAQRGWFKNISDRWN